MLTTAPWGKCSFPHFINEPRLRKVNSFAQSHPIGSERIQVCLTSKPMCLLGGTYTILSGFLMSMGRHGQAHLQLHGKFNLLSLVEPWEPPNAAAVGVHIWMCVGALVWLYLPALFAEVCLLSIPECLCGYTCGWACTGSWRLDRGSGCAQRVGEGTFGSLSIYQ